MKNLICIVCPKGCHLQVDEDNGYAVTGNSCPRGAEYGKTELLHPTRVLTSTVRVDGGLHRRLPVKTTAPVTVGQVVIANLLGTGVDVVATRNME